MENDIQQLAHLVKTSYLPQFRKDIIKTQDSTVRELLNKRLKEVETMCNKYLEE